jgi:hypothetical protein
LPIFFTPSGIVTLVSPLQPENALSPIVVTLSLIVTLVKPLQSLNAQSPMLVTGLQPSVDGIVTAPVGDGEMAGVYEYDELL